MRVHVLFICLLFLLGNNCYAKVNEITMAILMPAPVKKIYKNWQPLANFLSARLGQRVKIITPRGFDKAKKVIPKADFVYANSYLFSLLKDEIKLNPVAQMKNTGNSIYSRGRFIVRKDSVINNPKDLVGKKISLIGRYGAGAYLAPRAYLRKNGIDIEKDMEVEYTSNLKKSAYNVILGRSDIAIMCNVNYDILSKKMDTGELRVFDMTDSFPEAVMFTHLQTDSELVKRFTQALLENSEEMVLAMKPLNKMKILSFIDYDPVVESKISAMSRDADL